MIMSWQKIGLSVFACVISGIVAANTLNGKVVKVQDGDTITVISENHTEERVRMNRIDAPEKKQSFGDKAKRHLGDLVYDKVVTVEWKKRDKYGRILGDVCVGGTNVNLKMVADGFAWHYKHFDKTIEYALAEIYAREHKLGLWADTNSIEPYKFRKREQRK